jgi:carboxyl-terminal processing protease
MIGLLVQLSLLSQERSKQPYREDFEFLWKSIHEDYCYRDKKQTDWGKVKNHFAPVFDTVTNRSSFVLLLEKVLNELYDHHASLSTNTAESQRLVPSGTDIWAEYKNGKPTIIEVRAGFGAARAGLKAGMEVLAINDVPVEKAIIQFLPTQLKGYDKEPKDYALRLALAGKSIDDRKITIKGAKGNNDFFPDRPVALLRENRYAGSIETKTFSNNIGYIRINNRLWDNNLIALFDSVLSTLQQTTGLILDLRETPSGGNTTVARAILGSFIKKDGFYQKHELTAEESIYGVKRSWIEIVSQRKAVYTKPLVVLVNHWTGSVGEGITIGFDALKRATIIGTTMARLNGAIYSYEMPNTKIGFSFPVEKLFHVNGSRRENYIPAITIDMTKEKGEDPILNAGLRLLEKNKSRKIKSGNKQ